MKKIVHPVAGGLATLIIIVNWMSTAFSELSGAEATIIAVKSAIPWGFLLLIPAMAATGGTGFALSKGARGGLLGAKKKRMPVIAINGLIILVPAAFYLAAKARVGELDGMFYTVQGVELIAGAINLSMMALNMRDGLRLAGRLGTKGLTGGELSLIGSETIADGAMAFHFSKPTGLRFQAGQWAKITLINPSETDRGGNSRTFTIASSPDEDSLMFATRMRDTAFKRALKAMAPGTKVRISAPSGDLVLSADTSRPHVLIAGGIGITPFLAMIRQATKRGLLHDITLIYSNRSNTDAAFMAELQQTAISNPRFRLIATMTSADVKD